MEWYIYWKIEIWNSTGIGKLTEIIWQFASNIISWLFDLKQEWIIDCYMIFNIAI